MKTTVTDIAIDGRGFYQLSAASTKGKRFMRRVQGADSRGTAYSDDTRMTKDIADGAIAKGLIVVVNGHNYTGE